MPRPRKCRRVCTMPQQRSFGPLDGAENDASPIVLSIDEFESIRLIDLVGMTQEECAKQMGVARTTAQAIYAGARFKLAECIVHGKRLHIDGGDYVLYGSASACGCGCCQKMRQCENEITGGKENDTGNAV
ncbi:DUF134 domain-containing protein [Faecalispora anaeroviscerum]|uniref:DUF134 domain-containing protein n=1 Tax=Faecalispora anaeroviscerum TaxID=2991836 RepID=UPI0024B878C2|nr:DUF134 domain-containing protein [Faecalispora anaeroviscerum]